MTTKFLLMDANVLIDYRDSDLEILALVSRHVGPVQVLSTILAEEVPGVGEGDCARLGLRVIEPELEQVLRAGASRGRLSFGDHLCLIVAADDGYACVTNDRALRSACDAEQVETIWGLELMTKLVELGILSAGEVLAVAGKIHEANPLHITADLIARFKRKVTDVESRRR